MPASACHSLCPGEPLETSQEHRLPVGPGWHSLPPGPATVTLPSGFWIVAHGQGTPESSLIGCSVFI